MAIDALLEQSGQAPVGRFFCDAAAMQLRFGCDAKRESFCGMIGGMTLCWRGGSLHLWLAAELEGNPCRHSFGAGRNMLRQAGTLRARSHVSGQAHLHVAFWGEAGHQMASGRRSRKDGCHTSLNSHRNLKELRSRLHF